MVKIVYILTNGLCLRAEAELWLPRCEAEIKQDKVVHERFLLLLFIYGTKEAIATFTSSAVFSTNKMSFLKWFPVCGTTTELQHYHIDLKAFTQQPWTIKP